ncbi:MAG: hypothetical protein IPM81_02025 [Saprospirales bacterium]|nr:hypothetical protein [Saprospirales bacterium]
MSPDQFQTIVLLTLTALSLLMTALAVRTFILEKRQGLNLSSRRLYMAALCCALMGAVLFFHFQPSSTDTGASQPKEQKSEPTASAPPPDAAQRIEVLEARKTELIEQQKPISTEIETINQEIAKLKPAQSPTPDILTGVTTGTNTPPTPWWMLAGLAC